MSALMSINPGFILIAAGIIAALTPVKRARQAIAIIAPIAGLWLLTGAQQGVVLSATQFLDVNLILYKVDHFNFTLRSGLSDRRVVERHLCLASRQYCRG